MIALGVRDCRCGMQGLLIQTFSESTWQKSLINIMNVGKSPTGVRHCCFPQSLTVFCSALHPGCTLFLPTLQYTWNEQTMLSHPLSFTKISLPELNYSLKQSYLTPSAMSYKHLECLCLHCPFTAYRLQVPEEENFMLAHFTLHTVLGTLGMLVTC